MMHTNIVNPFLVTFVKCWSQFTKIILQLMDYNLCFEKHWSEPISQWLTIPFAQ